MKKDYKKFVVIIVVNLIVLLSGSTSYAQESADKTVQEKVTFIFVPGVTSYDVKETNKDAKKVHEYFANKSFGNYKISTDYKVVHWNGLCVNSEARKFFNEGLLRINSENNKSKAKRCYKLSFCSIINPFAGYSWFGDTGSNACSIFLRNRIHNDIFDSMWFIECPDNREIVYDLIQKEIDKCPGKYIIFGFSFGSEISLRFIIDKIVPYAESADNPYPQNFVGLITSADTNNTFFANILYNQVTPEAYKSQKNNFVKYFIENDKFWISCNHRNDPISVSLAPSITSYNDKGPGFIVCKTNKSGYMQSIFGLTQFFDLSTPSKCHEWCINKNREFANYVLQAYEETKRYKVVKSKILH